MHLVRHGMPQSEQRTTGVVHPWDMGQLPQVQSRYTALIFLHGAISLYVYDHISRTYLHMHIKT